MKTLLYSLLLVSATLGNVSCAVGDEEVVPGAGLVVPPEGSEPGGGDDGPRKTIEYVGFVLIDEVGFERYGGTTEKVQARIDHFFAKTTEYWNYSGFEAKNGGGKQRFKHDFVFKGILKDVYKRSSANLIHTYRERFDAERDCHFILLLDTKKDYDDERGAAMAGGIGDGVSGVTLSDGSGAFNDLLGNEWEHTTFAHELGHVRGVTDVYATMCRDGWTGNPVNGAEFDPMPCVMYASAEGHWSDYALHIIDNYAEYKIFGREWSAQNPGKDFFNSLYAETMKFKITVNNQPVGRNEIKAKFYGKVSNPGDNNGRYVIPTPYVTYTSGNDGSFTVIEVEQMYANPHNWSINGAKVPEGTNLGYGRWFNFLVTFEDVDGKVLDYLWIPEYEAQAMGKLEKNIVFEVNLKK